MKHSIICGLLVAGFSVALTAAETFGKGVTLKEVTPLERLISDPARFDGKTVRLEGVVTEVCQHMGCWMALAVRTADAKTLLVKVDDGVIVFPVNAKGKKASAEGVMEHVKMSDAEAKAAAEEHAKAEHREGAGTNWQLKATGAVIY
jgi:Domain of unknown function (DUF4920)